jgi:hypothetical protein
MIICRNNIAYMSLFCERDEAGDMGRVGKVWSGRRIQNSAQVCVDAHMICVDRYGNSAKLSLTVQ